VTIRQQPTDFVVKEHLDGHLVARGLPEWSLQTPHALYLVTKTSLTTPAAAGMLAKCIGAGRGAGAGGVRVGDVQYAGLKDKHAQTSQAMTVHFRTPPEDLATRITHQGIDAGLKCFLPRHVTAADINENEFRIAVRDLGVQSHDTLVRRVRLLHTDPEDSRSQQEAASSSNGPQRLLIPNYFGDQRFASLRKRQFAAKHLIAGDFEAALRILIATPLRKQSGAAKTATRLCAEHWGNWSLLSNQLHKSPARDAAAILARGGSYRDAFEALPHLDKRMAVESLQSHLWNATVSRCVQRHAAHGWLEASPTADLAFAHAAAVPDRLRHARIPMPSPHLPAAAPDADLWSEDLHAVLESEGLTLDALAIPGVRKPAFDHFDRPMFVEARSFAISPPSGTQRLDVHLQFHLPSGAYATNLLRALGQ
jgi:TruD family tRNA pseudouridine synthase